MNAEAGFEQKALYFFELMFEFPVFPYFNWASYASH